MDVASMDFSKLYALQPLFNLIPDSVIEEARTEALKNDSSMLVQTGAAIAGSFYKELGMDVSKIQSRYITRTGMLMLLIAASAGGIATILVSFLASRISSAAARNIRRDVFNKVEDFSLTEFDRFSTASLITRTTNDVTQVQMLLMMGIRMICYAPIMGIGGVMMALRKSSP